VRFRLFASTVSVEIATRVHAITADRALARAIAIGHHEPMRIAGYAGVAVLAVLVVSCGSSNTKANSISAVAPCVIAPQTTSTVDSHPPSVTIIGGTRVHTTVLQPHCLPEGHVAHALQVAEAIKASGIGCNSASLDAPTAKPEVPGGQLIESVSCDVRDESVSISLTPAPTIDLSLMQTGACFVNKTRPGGLSYAKGVNWIAAAETDATTKLIADRIHMPVEHFHC